MNQIWCRHDKWTDEIKSNNNKIKTAVTSFDNDHRWICAKNKFMTDNKMYDRWDKMKCEMIDKTIDNDRQDLQD